MEEDTVFSLCPQLSLAQCSVHMFINRGLAISIESSWSGVMWLRDETWELLCSKGPSSPFHPVSLSSPHLLASIFTSFILRQRQAHFKELTSKPP